MTGTTPFGESSASTIRDKIAGEKPRSILSWDSEIPPELSAIVERCFAKLRCDRYQSAKELAEEMQLFLSGALVGAYQYNLYDIVSKFVRRNYPILVTGATAAAALIGFGIYSYINIYQAEQEARAARVDTVCALDEAEDGLYYASIQLPANRLSEGNEGLARAALNNAPERLRNWEWGYLLKLAYPERFLAVVADEPVYDSDQSTAGNWSGSTGRLLLSLDGHQAELNSIAFNPAGDRVITSSADSTTRIWDGATGAEVLLLRRAGDIVQSTNFSRDGSRIVTTSTYTSTVDIWDAATGALRQSLSGHTLPVNQARFSHDGKRILTVSADATARIWNAETGDELRTLRGHEGTIMDGYFAEDGRHVVTASIDGAVRQWDINTGEHVELGRWEGIEKVITVQLSDGGQSAVFGFRDGTSGLWRDGSSENTLLESGRVGKMDYAGFSPDESAVIAPQKDRGAIIYDARTGNAIASIGREQGRLLSAVFSPDGKRAITGGTDGTVKIWMPGDVATPGRLRGHGDIVYRGPFSPDGQYVLTASYDKSAIVWDVRTGDLVARLGGHTSELVSAFTVPTDR